ncbi:spermidine synthase [Actinokineospora fastidiosa]|uniref:Spermidine synthase n=2 Tax=Actinokineospora fastidiosa TaxID=1816 RepID=A0A918LA43_9PSEU|nr:spermidine synthase [Actinokineospora fastidiosa]
MDELPTVIARAPGACGELVLRRVGAHHEIIADGMFLMDTRAGESERLLVDAAADRMPDGAPLVVGGLGVGFSLAAALSHPRVGEVVVVEREQAVIEWNAGPLGNADLLADPRAHCVPADLVTWLSTVEEPFGAVCLDIDNGPEWTLDEGNAGLYTDTGLDLLASALTPDGVLAVWSAAASADFHTRLRAHFADVEELTVPVPRGEPDVVYLATPSPRPSSPS